MACAYPHPPEEEERAKERERERERVIERERESERNRQNKLRQKEMKRAGGRQGISPWGCLVETTCRLRGSGNLASSLQVELLSSSAAVCSALS